MTAYVGYSEANRAPTPAELSCASPAAPCSLTNFFVGDPDLKQVVAHTVEAGLRGKAEAWTDTKVTLVRWVFPYRQRRRHPPTTGSYGVLNVHTAYQVTPKVQLFGLVENALNSRNETYGTFSPVGPDTPILQVPNASNTRSLSPAPPIGGYGGIRVTF